MLAESQIINHHGSGIKILLLLLLAAVICSVVILSWVPPVSRDALTHHLAVPKLYLQQGGIHEIPSVKFSYYPMNLDLLYMIPLYLGNDIIPKYIHFAFALLTAWLIFGYLRRRLGAVWAGCGALFFLSLPIIIKLSITVYVDLGLVFFSTAALMGLFKWVESRLKLKYLILPAVYCGLALGTKYNALIVFFLLTVFIPLLYMLQVKSESGGKKTAASQTPKMLQVQAVGSGVLFCLIALMIFSPWMIRNTIWTGNPVYPLYNSFFNPPKSAAANSLVADPGGAEADTRSPELKSSTSGWGPFAIRKMVYREGVWDIALIPVRIFFQGRDDDPRYFDGKLSPFLLLLPIFAFFHKRQGSGSLKVEKRALLWFAVLFILYAYLKTDMRIRYIAPAIPPLVILSTFGLQRIHESLTRQRGPAGRRWMQALVAALAAVVFTVNAHYIIQQFKLVEPLGYISGRVDREAYITRHRPEYPVIQYANGHLPADAKLMALFLGNRLYYSERETIFGNQLFLRTVKSVVSAESILEKLHQRRFTHLLIRYDLFNRWTDTQFDDKEKKMLILFFDKGVTQLLSKNGYGLYKLNSND